MREQEPITGAQTVHHIRGRRREIIKLHNFAPMAKTVYSNLTFSNIFVHVYA